MKRVSSIAGKLIVVVIVAFGAIIASVAVTDASLALYDDFRRKEINPAKWRGHEHFRVTPTGGRNPNREAVRQIGRKKLHLHLTTYGETSLNSGHGIGHFGLEVTNSDLVTAMQADVRVEKAIAEDCAANDRSSRARAQIIGFFFNDGTSSGPGDWTGDILAVIQKHLDSRGGRAILASIERCTTPNCSPSQALDVYVFGGWKLKRTDTLGLEWQPDLDRFVFTVNGQSMPLSYLGAWDDSLPPQGAGPDRFRIRNTAANCTDGRKKASMDVYFDNVRLNQEAAP